MSNRERLIKLLKYLYMFTDDEHPVDTGELTLAVLGEDTPAKRKTIKEDILLLESQSGIDIVRHKGSPDRFQWGNRLFDTAEVRMLIDYVSASNMLTENMSERFVQKLASLASIHEQAKLKKHLYTPSHLKSENVQVFYTLDKITNAIDLGKKVTFRYLTYNTEIKQVWKASGGETIEYKVSPYGLVLENSRYYLVGYCENGGQIQNFRIDRISDLIVLEEKNDTDEDFDIQDYLFGAFRMFSGKKENVILECKNELLNTVIDHFGTGITVENILEDTFQLETIVQLGPTFYAWLFSAGDKIKIVEPQSVVREYTDKIKSLLELYETDKSINNTI